MLHLTCLDDLLPYRLSVTCDFCQRVRSLEPWELIAKMGSRVTFRELSERFTCHCGGWGYITIREGRQYGIGEKTLILERPEMCGRYKLANEFAYIRALLDLDSIPNDTEPRYNVAPTQQIPVARLSEGRRELVNMRWGFLPVWSKEGPKGKPVINAKAESVVTNGMFRAAMHKRRCLIPADGFYEWKTLVEGEKRQPYLFEYLDGGVFCFAGLWESWKGADGEKIDTCAIITTIPSPTVARVHDRMPAIIPPEMYETWLSPLVSAGDAALMLQPDTAIMGRPVPTLVNSVKNQGPELVAEVPNPDLQLAAAP